jgi:hypothetical protein
MTQAKANGSQALELRERLVQVSLEWESYFGVLPTITKSISELDAALLVGMSEHAYCADGQLRTAVTAGLDFLYGEIRYQITANRPSGKKGSPVTWVNQKTEKKKAFGWDRLIWILYDRLFIIQEAWEFTADEYRKSFAHLTRLGPDHMRQGRRLFPV